MTIDEALRCLGNTASASDDKVLQFRASRLRGDVEIILKFKSVAMYTEAKYVAEFARAHIQELESSSRMDAELRDALNYLRAFAEETQRLPDTVRVADRSAEIGLRKKRPAREPGPYAERYPVGSPVKIASRADLEHFMKTWKLHHALVHEQLRYAGLLTIVRSVGYYHGGDVVYTLEGTGRFAWLEACLRPAAN
jgi:hypothetical protein